MKKSGYVYIYVTGPSIMVEVMILENITKITTLDRGAPIQDGYRCSHCKPGALVTLLLAEQLAFHYSRR